MRRDVTREPNPRMPPMLAPCSLLNKVIFLTQVIDHEREVVVEPVARCDGQVEEHKAVELDIGESQPQSDPDSRLLRVLDAIVVFTCAFLSQRRDVIAHGHGRAFLFRSNDPLGCSDTN